MIVLHNPLGAEERKSKIQRNGGQNLVLEGIINPDELIRGDYEHEDVMVYNAEEIEITPNFNYSKLKTKSYTEVTGRCDGIDSIKSIAYPWYWLTSTIRNCWDLSLSQTDPKRYWQTSKYPSTLFTCMLGQGRPHRQVIFELLELADISLKYVSFAGKDIWIDLTPETIHLSNFENGQDFVEWTGENIYRTHRFPPWYSEVLIDLVVETHDHALFYTEKTWKPFLGMRLPMIFGAPNMNVFLKDNGFKFAENLIDYSYDKIEDSYLRAKTLVSELKRLEGSDLGFLHDETLEIRKHNQKRALEISKEIDVPKSPKYEEALNHAIRVSDILLK